MSNVLKVFVMSINRRVLHSFRNVLGAREALFAMNVHMHGYEPPNRMFLGLQKSH